MNTDRQNSLADGQKIEVTLIGKASEIKKVFYKGKLIGRARKIKDEYGGHYALRSHRLLGLIWAVEKKFYGRIYIIDKPYKAQVFQEKLSNLIIRIHNKKI